jgi:hypothetical protein
MKWVLFAVVAVAALVGVVAAIGATLPRNHQASRTLRLRHPPADVWPAITEAAARTTTVPVDVIESVPPHRLVTRVKETEKMFGGTWTLVIAPDVGGSAVTITEDGWVANPIFRFVSRFVIGHHATMDALLAGVAKRLNEEAALSGDSE